MNLLLEGAPASVEIDGTEYALDADYRNAIKFELLMLDSTVPEEARGLLALRLFFPEIPSNLQEAFDRLVWFYRCGEEPQKASSKAGKGARIYSYEHDGGYIYAAFLDAYGIDLEEVSFLHWWKFRALFESLSEDATICRIMSFRAADTSKMKGEQRKYYQDMKRRYALPLPRDEQEKLDAISEALLGGDLAAVKGKSL